MKVLFPYRCDYCIALKEAANHWFIRLVKDSFILIEWDPDSAEIRGVEHICSDSCAAKALNKWLAERATARRPPRLHDAGR